MRVRHGRWLGWGGAALVLAACTERPVGPPAHLADDGQRIFRHDTFGDETFWTDTLHMNRVIEQAVTPAVALAVGLKVDADAVPPDVLAHADLSSTATTVALLELDAVVGVKAEVDANHHITRIGITCALCHSTVDDAVAPGIGHRLDGWPNHQLDVGRIISLSPALQDPAIQAVLTSWGPGKYDARWNIDHINGPVVIPPAYGLKGVALETYTGEGPVSYWNDYVAVTQMHGHGTFHDPRLGLSVTNMPPDLVTSKLPALFAYQMSLSKPAPPAGSVDAAASARGRIVFDGAGKCASCHTGTLYTDVNEGILHEPSETGMDPLWASRGATKEYRTTPLRALWQHAPYFHDGSARTLADVVTHYDAFLHLGLTPRQQADLVEYLKTL